MAFTLSEEEIQDLRTLNRATPDELKASVDIGCYSCSSVFTYQEIDQFVNLGNTALCPFCGIDAVIPIRDLPKGYVSRILQQMSAYYFE